jgi:diketogulonate reductase-like aldo/keto reductase
VQTTYLDCLVLHSPLANQQQSAEVWGAPEIIFHSGSAKQLGLSNCYDLLTLKDLYQTAEVKPAVIQNRFCADTQYDRSIRNFCQQQGKIYQSFWTLTANPRILADAKLQSLATKYQRSAAQVFFRYLTQLGIVPLTGTTSANHLREDLAIFDFELATDECGAVGHCFESVNVCFARGSKINKSIIHVLWTRAEKRCQRVWVTNLILPLTPVRIASIQLKVKLQKFKTLLLPSEES